MNRMGFELPATLWHHHGMLMAQLQRQTEGELGCRAVIMQQTLQSTRHAADLPAAVPNTPMQYPKLLPLGVALPRSAPPQRMQVLQKSSSATT